VLKYWRIFLPYTRVAIKDFLYPTRVRQPNFPLIGVFVPLFIPFCFVPHVRGLLTYTFFDLKHAWTTCFQLFFSFFLFFCKPTWFFPNTHDLGSTPDWDRPNSSPPLSFRTFIPVFHVRNFLFDQLENRSCRFSFFLVLLADFLVFPCLFSQ